MARAALTSFIVLLLQFPVAAQVKLAWKYPAGQQLRSQVTIDAQQTLTINGVPIATRSQQNRVVKTTVGPRLSNGNFSVETSVESMKANIQLPGGVEFKFDSAEETPRGDGTTAMLNDLLRATARTRIIATHGPDGRVTGVEVPADVLGGLDQAARQAIESQLDPASLQQSLNQEQEQIPASPVSAGDKWVRSSELPLEGGQVLSFKTELTYEGAVEEQGATLDKIATKVTEVGFDIKANSSLPLKLKQSNLQVEDKGGALLFDRELGQIVQKKSELHITGSLMFEAGGSELPAELDLRLNMAQSTLR
jgi:hypothetical protein